MAFVVGFDCWVAFSVAPRARGSVPLVAAAALVALVLVMAVAAAGLAVLVGVLVVVAMAVAGGLAGLCEPAGNEGLDAGVAAALGARIDRDAGLGERVDGTAADAAADERVNATVGEQARQGAVAGATGAHDLLVEHLAILDVVDLELSAAAKVHKDAAVVVRRCHPHGADLLCWPFGRRRGDGGVCDIAALDTERPPGKLSSVLRPMITGQPLVHATKWRMSARLDTTMSPSHPMPQSSHTATIADSLHVMSATYTAMGMFLTCGPCS